MGFGLAMFRSFYHTRGRLSIIFFQAYFFDEGWELSDDGLADLAASGFLRTFNASLGQHSFDPLTLPFIFQDAEYLHDVMLAHLEFPPR